MTGTDTPRDILSITATDRSAVTLNSELLRCEIRSQDYDDVEFGIDIHQDGPDIGLKAGTNWAGRDQPKVHSFHSLTPEQSREIASTLEEAADKAEEAANGQGAEERDSESFIQRLMP